MPRLDRYRNMTPTEVGRIHSGLAIVTRESRGPEEIVADLICYCGSSWPEVIQEAIKLANQSKRGSE